MHWLKRRIFALDADEASLQRRGIACDPGVAAGLGVVLDSFSGGYQAALESRGSDDLVERLERGFDPAFAGFAYEGAGMLLALLDHLTPWDRRRVERFIGGPAAHHDYIVCIGVGFALARLPWTRRALLSHAGRYLPGCAALVVDGFGFHEAYFHTERTVHAWRRPVYLEGYAARSFDSGVGRALWFVGGADPDRIAVLIARFEPSRHSDLWAGLGLACSYAGNAHHDPERYRAVLERLVAHAGPHRRQLELGVVFSAETRQRAGNPARWTSQACEVVLRMPYAAAARLGAQSWDRAREAFQGRPRTEVALGVHENAAERVLEGLAQPAAQPAAQLSAED